MTLDHLWAGWRSAYVTTVGIPESEHGEDVDLGDEAHCVFCRIAASDAPDDERHVLATTATSIAMLNAYPYASGHVLVMPIRHVAGLAELDAAEHADLWTLLLAAVRAIEDAYHPEGFNLGANIGRAAGAGIPRHLHLHVLPRWVGDTNFMTAVASTRVLPEALSDSFARLRASWPA